MTYRRRLKLRATYCEAGAKLASSRLARGFIVARGFIRGAHPPAFNPAGPATEVAGNILRSRRKA
ncbi:MAG: hypothetical protein ACUVR3_08390, partial [Candidatus Roseilinea sp.]|uniref:hypothetical protein n=1 Tax=Candidatus Roseilinea sp. TaxID=2838777 RepID=UPI0040491D36